MKKLNLFIVVLAGLFIFTSCEEATGPQLSTNPQEPTFTNAPSGDSFVLTEENKDEVVFDLEWSRPGLGFRVAANYVVEMAEAGTEFAEPATLTETSETSVSITVGELNTKLIAADFTANVEADIEVRVKTEVNDDVEDMYSSPFTISVTPYLVNITYPEIYVPGGYQSASGYGSDWTPQDAPALASVEENERYEGYVYVANNNELKFTEERSWDVNYGDNGADGTLEQNGANIQVSAGYYKINVDINTLTYTTLNTDWGLIGDATGSWDNDQDMTYDAANKVWTITLDLSAGEIKFRANDTWDLNYGDNEGDGVLDENSSGNIQVPASGNYTVVLDLGAAPYTYELIQN